MSREPGTYAVFNTSEGTIVCKLFEKDAPKTVENFVELAEGKREWTHPVGNKKSNAKLYDGTIFHRVIPDFMIQGGDPAGTGFGGPGYKFADETKGSPHSLNAKGKLAMANAKHQRIASLYHRRADSMAHRQTHDIRRSRRGLRRSGENFQGAPQLTGQAKQASDHRNCGHRTGLRQHLPDGHGCPVSRSFLRDMGLPVQDRLQKNLTLKENHPTID
jgi:cyclophilin family peptidyl-prolyl cis-trans isomerase